MPNCMGGQSAVVGKFSNINKHGSVIRTVDKNDSFWHFLQKGDGIFAKNMNFSHPHTIRHKILIFMVNVLKHILASYIHSYILSLTSFSKG